MLLAWDAPASEDLLGYNIYRDGDSIANTVETEFTDLDLEFGLYEYHVTAVYDEGESGPSNTATANVGNVLVYCDSEGGGGQYFSHVVFGDIDNTSGFEGYGDFTDLSTDVQQGTTVPLDITITSPSTGDDIGIWIDFNQDGEFQEAENLICEMDNGQGAFTWDIEIPEDAVLGMTRLRLKDKYWEIGCDPCGYTTWGETEDYSVNIVEFTGIEQDRSISMDVFPNPASGVAYIRSDEPMESLTLYNYSGQPVIELELNGNGAELHTGELNDGIYLLMVETKMGIISRRLSVAL